MFLKQYISKMGLRNYLFLIFKRNLKFNQIKSFAKYFLNSQFEVAGQGKEFIQQF